MRYKPLCDRCKMDHRCNHKCIKKDSDYTNRYYICPQFIYDDDMPLTNAELLSSYLKSQDKIDHTAMKLWQLVREECDNVEDLVTLLRASEKIEN